MHALKCMLYFLLTVASMYLLAACTLQALKTAQPSMQHILFMLKLRSTFHAALKSMLHFLIEPSSGTINSLVARFKRFVCEFKSGNSPTAMFGCFVCV